MVGLLRLLISQRKRGLDLNVDAHHAQSIIDATGKPLYGVEPSKLANDLSELFFQFRAWRAITPDKTTIQIRNQIADIEKHSRKLISALGLTDGVDVMDAASPSLTSVLQQAARARAETVGAYPETTPTPIKVDPSESELRMDFQEFIVVRRALEGIQNLHDWVNITHKIIEIEGRDSADISKSWLMAEALPKLYETHSGEPLGWSRPPQGGEPFGPGIRFLSACMKTIGEPMNPEAIVKRIERYQPKWDTRTQKK